MNTALVPEQDQKTLLSVITRVAADPACDIEKMERLLAMYERTQQTQARAAFDSAMAGMQDELPSIGERGDAAGRYTYALWEDIQAAIKPVLKKHGFALSFRMEFANGIAVTAVLSHSGGHRETTTILLPADPSGNKNAVQAVASSIQYGKRYTASALLNLTSHGEDDDAFASCATTISDKQLSCILDYVNGMNIDTKAFCKALKVTSIDTIPVAKYDLAIKMLKAKEAKLKEQAHG